MTMIQRVVPVRCFGGRATGLSRLMVGLVLLLGSGPLWAAAGKVIFVSGQAFLLRGGQTPIERGTEVQPGDILVTYVDGRVQLLMSDGDRIALRPNTRFRIDDYKSPNPQASGSGPSVRLDRVGRAFYSLLRGGFRSLTNSRGQRDLESYQVRTPVATIGIRGTYYVVRHCNNDCFAPRKSVGKTALQRQAYEKNLVMAFNRAGFEGDKLPAWAAYALAGLSGANQNSIWVAENEDVGAQSGPELVPNGTAAHTIEGEISVQTANGPPQPVGRGQYYYASSPSDPGQVGTEPPVQLSGETEEPNLTTEGGEQQSEQEQEEEWAGGGEEESSEEAGEGGEFSARRDPNEGQEGGDGDDGSDSPDRQFQSESAPSETAGFPVSPARPIQGNDSTGNTTCLTACGGSGTGGVSGGGTGGFIGGTGGSIGTGGATGTGGSPGAGGATGTGRVASSNGANGDTQPNFAHSRNNAILTRDASGNLTSFRGPGRTGTAPLSEGTYSIGTSQNVNTGQALNIGGTTTLIRWGRWAGGTANFTPDSGPANSGNLSQSSVHWIYSENAPVIPITGTANYVLIGNTNPTDDNGNVGVLGSASLSANFTNQTVTNSIGLSVNGQTWNANNNANPAPINSGAGTFEGQYSSVSGGACSGNCSGEFAGFFAGDGGASGPPGAGMSYSLSNDSDRVHGTAAFERSP